MSATSVKAFVAAITAGDLKAVQARIKAKENPNSRYNDPSTPGAYYNLLHKAVDVGHEPIIAVLIKAGADVGAADNGGATPLHWLAAHSDERHLKIAGDLLTKHKAPIAARDAKGGTPLHAAAAQGNAPLTALLLKHGASGGKPGALHVAARKASVPVIDLLLEAGEQPGALDKAGFTPLMRLLSLPPSRTSREDAGEAARQRAAAALQLLARADLDWAVGTQEPGGGKSALLMAAAWPQPSLELAAALLATGAAADVADRPAGMTPLMHALAGGHAELAALLVQHTRQIDAASSDGSSAVSLAAALAEWQGGAGAAAGSSAGSVAALEAVLAARPKLEGAAGVVLLRRALAAKWDGCAAHLVQLVPDSSLAALDLTFQGLLDQGLGQAACALLARTTPGGLDALAAPDADGCTALHRAAAAGQAGLCAGLLRLGLGGNTTTREGDTALHLAARAGQVEACRALVGGGVDPLWRNGKNRTPAGQLKLPEGARSYLAGVEEAAKQARLAREQEVWGTKLAATQTASACVLRAV